jgi:hypothetical protein
MKPVRFGTFYSPPCPPPRLQPEKKKVKKGSGLKKKKGSVLDIDT